MIHVSELAAMALQESLQASGIEPDKGLRLKEEGAQFRLHLDSPSDNDRVIWHNKAPVLIIDRDLEAEIGDALIDVEDKADEPQLVIRRQSHQ